LTNLQVSPCPEGEDFSSTVAAGIVSGLDRAVLGLTGKYLDSIDASHYQVPSGFVIISVSSQYITSAGIKKGDIITKIDGKTVTSGSVITSEIATKKPGETVTMNGTRYPRANRSQRV
jgi:S1-C subfamily serine protease